MGTVYLARSRGGRAVAVKVAHPELAADRHFRARFRAEVEAARKVGGFHTAPVVDADPDAEAPWLATAYIPGPTLSDLLAERGPMDEHQLRLLGAALAEALQAVHACGLVHRDLKPGNIIMAEDGPRVLDFGIARAVESTRLTSTGAAFGTPGYLAPEQAQGLEVTGATDVFALGAVLVAAAGGSAFGDGTPMGLMYRSVHEPADLSEVPQGLRPLVAACLCKNPTDRPTPDSLLNLLPPDAAPHPPAPATPLTPDTSEEAPTLFVGHRPPIPAARPRARGPAMAVVALVTVGALVGGAVYLANRDGGSGTPSASGSKSSLTPSAGAPPGGTGGGITDPPEGGDAADGGDKARDEVTVRITAEDGRSWVSAKDSVGELLFDGLLQQGETKTFSDEESINLVLGEASAVQLVVNGKKIENDFTSGTVERLTYTKDD
ncbi:RodZ domain-containing protein [Streptomyces sp. NPDC057474]|uniref:RodZ domain-containing protein n=1 Tax=Streptomyces sp. NPDC057474 TaxID=3346144 RepID=UPI003694DE9B